MAKTFRVLCLPYKVVNDGPFPKLFSSGINKRIKVGWCYACLGVHLELLWAQFKERKHDLTSCFKPLTPTI